MKQLKKELLVVVRDLKRLSQKIDKITKRVEKIGKPQKTKTVELRDVPGIDPAIVARAIRGKIYPSDIILAHIIANPEGIDINTLQKKTEFEYKPIKQIILSLRQEGRIRSKLKEGLLNPKYAAGMSRPLYFEA